MRTACQGCGRGRQSGPREGRQAPRDVAAVSVSADASRLAAKKVKKNWRGSERRAESGGLYPRPIAQGLGLASRQYLVSRMAWCKNTITIPAPRHPAVANFEEQLLAM